MEPVIKSLPVEKKPKLLDQVREAIRTKHYSLRTEEVYVHWIKRFFLLIKIIWELAYGYVQALGLAKRIVD